jgi:hypothetical protein
LSQTGSFSSMTFLYPVGSNEFKSLVTAFLPRRVPLM